MSRAVGRPGRPLREILARACRFLSSLRGRLLVLTVLFVMLAEVFIYVPSIANQRQRLLMERLELAQIAALAREATMGESVDPSLAAELLENAGVLTVTLVREDRRELMLSVEDPPLIDRHVRLGAEGVLERVLAAFASLLVAEPRTFYVVGVPVHGGGDAIEFTFPESTLKADLLAYSVNILLLSLAISAITATLVFISLDRLLVRPMRRITAAMAAFREAPQDARRIIAPREGESEIGLAETALAEMQRDLHAALQHKTRLAALGTAVSKINHDLRNILASSQLVTDRLAASEDPTVQRLAPMLTRSIGRAIDLCTNTLRYGKAEEPAPVIRPVDLAMIAADVASSLDLPADGRIAFAASVPEGLPLEADADQLFRVLLNLARNAAQALEAEGPDRRGRIMLSAKATPDGVRIEIEDDGPGIAEAARAGLFKAFVTSARKGGTGLGLAIAQELIEAHGGRLSLLRSDGRGTLFAIDLPAEAREGGRRRQGVGAA